MIKDLTNKINIETLETAIKNLHIVRPTIITDLDNNFSVFENPVRLCLVQINYTDNLDINGYSVGKIHVNINEKKKLVFTNDYIFHAINFYKEYDSGIIYSYNIQGDEIYQYTVNRDVLYNCISHDIYMIKSTGDVYQPNYKKHSDTGIETIRAQWFSTDKLLCYSEKLDGRKSFYITINTPLNISVNASQFITN